MLAWLLAACVAAASPLSDLVARVPGDPVMVMQCDRASRVLDSRAGPAFGVDALRPLVEGDQGVFDVDASLSMALTADPEGVRLVIDARVQDPDTVSERLQALEVDGVQATLIGDRLQMVLPQGPGFVPDPVPLVARADAHAGPGCVFVASAGAVFGGQMPLLDQATWIEVTFEDPDVRQEMTIDLEALPPPLQAVLDGEGPPAFGSVRTQLGFDVVVQVHGTFEEVLDALPLLTSPANALVLLELASAVPAAVRGVPGIQVALGGPQTGGALVIPMKRPRCRRRLLTAARRIGESQGMTVEAVARDLLRLQLQDRAAVHVGARRGLLVLALREDVVRDVLTDEGDPWFADPTGPFGVRMRTAPGAAPLLEGLDGYVELRYADGALHATVWPPAE